MWRKLTLMLFLFVLAQTANALPISEVFSHENVKVPSLIEVEQQVDKTFDDDVPEKVFNLPSLHRLSPSLFLADIQASPHYFLVIEFFKNELSAALFKNLANPPLIPTWFEQLSHKTNSSRLCGWKDGNSLYTARTTYHS